MSATTVRITYEVTVPDKWDLDVFATETAVYLVDIIDGALHDHPDKSVKWVHTRQTIPANQHPTWGEAP